MKIQAQGSNGHVIQRKQNEKIRNCPFKKKKKKSIQAKNFGILSPIFHSNIHTQIKKLQSIFPHSRL